MNDSLKMRVTTLDRINLRLSSETFRAIDDARGHRAGNVSRNTWIAEAIEEKLTREAGVVSTSMAGQAANA
jgi:predicted HicB family RNase H-like nuclease